MSVLECLLDRKSVRAFWDKKVPKDDIIKILEHAKHSPSGTNTQPWKVAVVTGHKKYQLDTLLLNAFENNTPRNPDYNYYPTDLCPEFKSRRLACGLQMFSALDIKRDDKDRRMKQWGLNYSAFGAPVALYFFADKCIEKGSFMDMGMFLQSIMLLATELGLATCAQAALAEYPDIVRSQLPEFANDLLLCGMALGYEDKSAVINNYRTVREELISFAKFYD